LSRLTLISSTLAHQAVAEVLTQTLVSYPIAIQFPLILPGFASEVEFIDLEEGLQSLEVSACPNALKRRASNSTLRTNPNKRIHSTSSRKRPQSGWHSRTDAVSHASQSNIIDLTFAENQPPGTVISIDDDDEKPSLTEYKQETNVQTDSLGPTSEKKSRVLSDQRGQSRYTVGDGFCGAGGVSRGAVMAGMAVLWAFDMEPEMCASYGKNFPNTKLACADAFNFTTEARYGSIVDILHLSPPCQFFSPAHTVAGQNDEVNVAASFVIGEMLRKTKPRIVTLENTSGLLERHDDYLAAIVQQFTAHGYSVRYKVLNLADFGVPQNRRRLILIASW
jgi:hypothetical protein